MSNVDKARQLKEEFDNLDVFGGKITVRQLWWIIKFAKIVRKFARNNVALYNLCNEIFTGVATFKEVKKLKDGTEYPGMSITMKVDGENVSYSESGEGDDV